MKSPCWYRVLNLWPSDIDLLLFTAVPSLNYLTIFHGSMRPLALQIPKYMIVSNPTSSSTLNAIRLASKVKSPATRIPLSQRARTTVGFRWIKVKGSNPRYVLWLWAGLWKSTLHIYFRVANLATKKLFVTASIEIASFSRKILELLCLDKTP